MTGTAFIGFWLLFAPGDCGSAQSAVVSRRSAAHPGDSGTEILVTDRAVFERSIVDRGALNVRTWIQADDEAETLDGFVRCRETGPPFPPTTIDPPPRSRFSILPAPAASPKGGAFEQRLLGRALPQ